MTQLALVKDSNMASKKQPSDSFMRWMATIGTAVLLGILGWIGLNVADIPVIRTEIVQIKEGMSAQVQINVKRLDDHEARLRIVEGRR